MKLRARDTFWMVRTGLLEHLVSCFCKTNRRPRSRRPISAVLLSLPFIARNRTTVVRASPTTVGPSNPSENHSPTATKYQRNPSATNSSSPHHCRSFHFRLLSCNFVSPLSRVLLFVHSTQLPLGSSLAHSRRPTTPQSIHILYTLYMTRYR